VVDNGNVFIGGSKSSVVYSYTMSGSLRWTSEVDFQVSGAPAAANGRVYVATGATAYQCTFGGYLHALRQTDGKERFNLFLPCGARDSSPTVDNLAIYLATWFEDSNGDHRGRVYKIRETDFTTEWTYTTVANQRFTNTPVVGSDGVVAVSGKTAFKIPKDEPTPKDGVISGSELLWFNVWCSDILEGTTYSSPTLASGYVVFGGGNCNNERGLISLDFASGVGGLLHNLPSTAVHSSPAFHNGKILYGYDHALGTGFVGRIDILGGSPDWEYDTGHFEVGRSSPAVSGNGYVYVSAGGYLVAVTETLGAFVWEHQTDSKPQPTGGSSPAIVQGYLFVGSHSSEAHDGTAGFLYAFKDP
jgi:outer membrane protein assembly factor BamB